MHGCGREEREDEEARILDQSFGASVARGLRGPRRNKYREAIAKGTCDNDYRGARAAAAAAAAAAVPGEAWAKFTLFLAPLQTRSRQMRMWDLAPAHSPTLKGEAIHA
jgi:hypothetical protein